MMTGKERYEARRQQQHETEMARMKMQQKNYERESDANEVAVLAMKALKAFLNSDACLYVEKVDDNTTRVTFSMPALVNAVAD